MAKCGACGRFAATDVPKCNKCSCFYHRGCAKIPKDVTVNPSWLCPGCKAGGPRKDNTDQSASGVKDRTSSFESLPTSSPSIDKSDEILQLVQDMAREMKSFRKDFNALRDEMSTFKSTMVVFGGRMDSMEEQFAGLVDQVSELRDRPDPEMMLATIEQLKAELNDRDQEALLNDLEITGIPESEGENVGHLVSLIAGKLGVECSERDVVSVERAGLRRAHSSSGEPVAPRPRPIVVRLARRAIRDSFLQSARVRRRLTTEGLGLPDPPARAYINERLTKPNKVLFYKVREESRRLNFRYAWTRGGRIFVRRESGKASFRVRSDADIKKIFGSDTVGSK